MNYFNRFFCGSKILDLPSIISSKYRTQEPRNLSGLYLTLDLQWV